MLFKESVGLVRTERLYTNSEDEHQIRRQRPESRDMKYLKERDDAGMFHYAVDKDEFWGSRYQPVLYKSTISNTRSRQDRIMMERQPRAEFLEYDAHGGYSSLDLKPLLSYNPL